MSQHPIGFLSYVRDDDAHERGRLSEVAKRLSGEVRIQTGEKFEIFQDRNDIQWGQQWKERIEDSLDGVTFLIPIVTPGFFKSPACRAELERFLKREKTLKRNDLILPVYYVNCPILHDDEKRKSDPLAMIIAERQYADLRELRFEPITSPEVGKMLAKMGAQIIGALEREQPRKPTKVRGKTRRGKTSTARKGRASAESPQQLESKTQSVEATRGPVAKTEPPTIIVDALHRGDHPTLTAALAAAKPGDRILMRPGLYREGVTIDKPVEIIGDGELGEVVIEAKGENVVRFKANMGRIANLTLQQVGAGDWFAVDIAQGRLDLEGCDITSESYTCVGIHGGADPRLRRNRIHDGKESGVLVYDNGQGTFEDNAIFANENAGVSIMTGGNPTLRHNRIYDGKSSGVHVYKNGLGTLEDNDVFANANTGVRINTGGNATLRRNRIHDGKQSGVFVHEKGQGTLEDNEIVANQSAGVQVRDDSNVRLRRNKISKNGYQAIVIAAGGGGVFEDNDLSGNTKGAWHISPDCEKNVTRTGNLE
jgi:F-box protein 11